MKLLIELRLDHELCFYNFFIFDRELAHLTHDLDYLNSSLYIETHIINELNRVSS